jgi:hypothetical protein
VVENRYLRIFLWNEPAVQIYKHGQKVALLSWSVKREREVPNQ